MTQARSTWVVFDYGGVICTPQPDEDVALLAAAAGGVPVPDFQGAYWAYRLSWDRAELDGTTYWHKVAAALGISFSLSQIAELTRLDIASWLHLCGGTVALIEDLVGAGYPLALLSNAPAEVAEVVADLPVARAFSHRAFSCFLGAAKPEPECYQAVLGMLGARAADVIFIDDRPDNVAAAAGLGIRSVHFSTPAQARTALAAHGVTATPRG
ncbi:MAG TPA: HAD family phosphatase [Streptosporangiaceae bacterium]|jgi:putative hydrolase of the HAD superfamily